MLEELSFRVNPDYRFFKLAGCTYHQKRNLLVCDFFFDESVAGKLDALKPALESAYTELVTKEAGEVKCRFKYTRAYIDELLLKMEVRKMLVSNFSILTLDLGEDDIAVEQHKDGFTVNLYLPPQHHNFIRSREPFKAFVRRLHDENFCTFEILFNSKVSDATGQTRALERLEQYMASTLPDKENVRVDKTLAVKKIEYWLGKPIKQRPVKIEHLRVSPDEQITAGTIERLTKREYTRLDKQTGEEQPRVRWTFVLNDGIRKMDCVFFPTTKTHDRFEKLTDGTAVCVAGVCSEYNGRTNFRVQGVSFCDL